MLRRARAKKRRSSLLNRAILIGMMVGGSFLAFRWDTPIGNITIARLSIVAALIGIGTGIIRVSALPSRTRPLLGASLLLVLLVTAGLLYTPAPSTGLVVAANTIEAVLLLIVGLLLARSLLFNAERPHASAVARLPLWGYLPTGVLGVYQAIQLLRGIPPSIPLLGYAQLDEATINSARTAFGSGLNDFDLDRVAAATGDPATYGILSAVTIAYCLWAKREKFFRPDLLFWGVFSLALCGVVLSSSISAFIVLVVALLCNIPDTVKGWRRILVAGAAVTTMLVVLFQLVPTVRGFPLSAQQRVVSELSGQGSADGHLSLLWDAWEVFGYHPFVGVGTGGLTYHQYGYEVGFSSVHNVLLLALAEGGILLGAALFIFWLSLWRGLVPHAMLLPLTTAWLVYLDINRLPALWATVGIIVALSWWQRRQTCHRRSSSLAVPSGAGVIP